MAIEVTGCFGASAHAGIERGFLPVHRSARGLFDLTTVQQKGVAMRKLLFAAAAAALNLSMGVIAHAADMRRPALKAPPPAPVYSWTGCYVGIGGGYGMYNEELALVAVQALPGAPVGTIFVDGLTQGGRGWLATAQLGCDVQFAGPFGGNWVFGAFVDADWANIKGRHTGGNQNRGMTSCAGHGPSAGASAGSSAPRS
jgi:hypothetical protein